MSKRPHYQQTAAGTFRKQVLDPTTGRRVSLTAPNPIELAARVNAMVQLRRDLKSGLRSIADVRRATSLAIHGRATVAEIWREWCEPKKALSAWARSLDSIWNCRLATLADLPVHELTESRMISWWARELASGIEETTAYQAFIWLGAAFRLAVRSHRIDAVPWGAWRPHFPKPDRREACRSMGELEAIVAEARRRDERAWTRGRHADLAYRVAIMFYNGLRQGEAGGLGWDFVEIDDPPFRLTVHYQVCFRWRQRHPEWIRPMDPTKGRHNRTLELGCSPEGSALAALRLQRDQLRARGWYDPHGPVFPGHNGQWRLHPNTIAPTDFRTCVLAAGLPNPAQWTTHSLRHSMATLELIAHAGDIRTVMARTGHATASVLEGYLHTAGRGLVPSKLPQLGAGSLVPPGREITIGADLPASQAMATAQHAMIAAIGQGRETALSAYREKSAARAAARAARRRKRARRAHGEPVVGLLELARAAVLAGKDRPPEITTMVDEAYSRAYAKRLRRTKDPVKAASAGRAARRARLGAWARCLSLAKAAQAAPAAPEEPKELTP